MQTVFWTVEKKKFDCKHHVLQFKIAGEKVSFKINKVCDRFAAR